VSAIDPEEEPGRPERRGGCPDPSGAGVPRDDNILPADFVVPDDLRDLAAEVAAYQRERRQAARRERLRVLFGVRRWRRFGLSGPVVVGVLLGFVLVASLATLLAPLLDPPPQPAPLAAENLATPGSQGALLPDLKVTVNGLPRPVRDLRPAVLALVPSGCECASQIDHIRRETTSYALPLYLVGAGGQDDELTTLAADAGAVTTEIVLDEAGTLRTTYAATDLTLVLVHADGVVEAVIPRPDGARLASDLAVLARPGVR